MKSTTTQPSFSLVHGPIAVLALAGALAWISTGTAQPVCENESLHGSEAALDCRGASEDSGNMTAGPGEMSTVAESRYSERGLQMLNETVPLPADNHELLEEMDRLMLQQRRFERQYGPESIAARSVRLRLHDLSDYVMANRHYAAQGWHGVVYERDR